MTSLGNTRRWRRDTVRSVIAVALLCGLVLFGLTALGAADGASRVSVAASSATTIEWPRDVKKALRSIKPAACQRHVELLASDLLEGREVGTEGGRAAGDYIARAFEDAGLQPGGTFGRYFQPFSVRGVRSEEGPLELTNRVLYQRKLGAKREEFDFGKDFWPDALSFESRAKGAGVLLHAKTPASEALATRIGFVEGEPAREAIDAWLAAGLVGLVIVSENDPEEGSELATWPRGELGTSVRMPIVRMTRSAATKLVSKLGGSIRKFPAEAEAPEVIDRGTVTLDVSRRGYNYGRGRNVIGVLPGNDPERAKEVIVIGAHYDHVGRPRDPRLTRGRVGEIHNGADDNASGTTGLIEMATAFAESGLTLPRTLVFIAFDAEEAGLLGSHYYSLEPPQFPIAQTVAMINMDMISRNGPREMKIGKEERFAGLNRIVEEVAASVKVVLDPTGMEQYIKRSDQWPFMEKGVPAIFIYGGDHADYHTENDDPDKINPVKIADITKLMFLCAYRCAHHEGTFKAE